MIWLNPAAWLALLALAAPIAIHILVQHRAERLPFPTLRFIRPTRLAAMRRYLLEDVRLLALRAAILATAVAALAGPLFLTPARREAWNARLARAIVVDDRARNRSPQTSAGEVAFRTEIFEGPVLAEGVRRARAWLDTVPPARREIVIVSPFPLGSLTAADISAIPGQIGVRFERAGPLPPERTVSGGTVLTGEPPRLETRRQTILLSGAATSVRETRVPDAGLFPVDVVPDGAARPAVAAVLSQRLWPAPDGRRSRLVLARNAGDQAVVGASPPTQSWIGDAIASIARDEELQSEAVTIAAGLADAKFSASPWTTVAIAADGRPLAAAAESSKLLLVVSAADASHIVTPLLLHAIVKGLGGAPDLRAAEVIPIPAAMLQEWTRPAAPATIRRLDDVERDDRRWLWAFVLALLAAESWIRRSRRADLAETEERARVA